MDDESIMWIALPRYTEEYIKGIKSFLENAFPIFSKGNEMQCPCKNCMNRKWHRHDVIYDHLICTGPSPIHVQWICDISSKKIRSSTNFKDDETGMDFGDNLDAMFNCTGMKFANLGECEGVPNVEAKRFYEHVKEGKQPLYPGCTNFSRLSFKVRLYYLKCAHGISESAFGDLLKLIKEAFPHAHLPLSFNAAKNIIKDLGIDYKKIHACPNSCMLYWAENEGKDSCHVCGTSRWIIHEKKESGANNDPEQLIHKVPANVMRYFPLKSRLQRMFMCKEYSKMMTWHAVGRIRDGKLRHPADAEAWKMMDSLYPDFFVENRNVRLGLAADGFNPFRTMNLSHSTWPIILVNYNLPPWLCMKQENLILSTLISGPKSPKNNIDVYMQPLITELKELWGVGVETYDALTNENFNLRARLLWTISDFPGYAMLSGWSTKGYLGCPLCHYETTADYLKHSKKICYMDHRKFLDPAHKWRFDKRRFNGKFEMREAPPVLSGVDIENLLKGYINKFGAAKEKGKKKDSPFKKKSIFFDLPYWRHNPLRHNLDAMHIENNVCDSILGTLLNIGRKTKDHINACLDLQELGIRKSLHPVKSADGNNLEIRATIFDMTNKEKEVFCSVLKNVKLPYDCASNISRYVHSSERKIAGYKSHDAHFILHYLLPFCVKKTLNPEVALPLIRLSAFLRGLWNKAIDLEDIKGLQQEIVEILCHFEMIFTQPFFDIMVHLLVHLCNEVEYGGPEHLRCMFSIERYLRKMKSFVRNRSKPEGSIAECYLAEECVTFCSRFLGVDGGFSANLESCSAEVQYHIGTRKNKDGKIFKLKESDWEASHRYVLFNSGNEDIERLIGEHHALVNGHAGSKRYRSERAHTGEFWKWLKEVVPKRGYISRDLEVLSLGPNRRARKFAGYVINGYRFHTKSRDSQCTTQNSGIFLTAITTSFASAKDQNPIVGNVNYYGSIEEIIELDYWGSFTVVLFKCCWYQEENDNYGLTKVNFSRLCHKSDPYVLASQVRQIFYVGDPTEKTIYYVIKKLPKDWCDSDIGNATEEDIRKANSLKDDFRPLVKTKVGARSWSRMMAP
ncbi:hypothetical protein OROMI_021860 [Orobanche minor]